MRFHQWGIVVVVVALFIYSVGYFIARPWHRAFSALDDLIDPQFTCTMDSSVHSRLPSQIAGTQLLYVVYSLRTFDCLPCRRCHDDET